MDDKHMKPILDVIAFKEGMQKSEIKEIKCLVCGKRELHKVH